MSHHDLPGFSKPKKWLDFIKTKYENPIFKATKKQSGYALPRFSEPNMNIEK